MADANSGSGSNKRQFVSKAVININTAGDNTIVATPVGADQVVSVIKMLVVASAAVNITLKSGAATNLTGAMAIAANSGFGFDGDSYPLYTSVGEAFIINLSGNVQVSGFVLYAYDAPAEKP